MDKMKRRPLVILFLASALSLVLGAAIGARTLAARARQQIDELNATRVSARLLESVDIRELIITGKTNEAVERIQGEIATDAIGLAMLADERPQLHLLHDPGLIAAARSLKRFPFTVEPAELEERFKDVVKQVPEKQ